MKKIFIFILFIAFFAFNPQANAFVETADFYSDFSNCSLIGSVGTKEGFCVVLLQSFLKEYGFVPGPIDGRFGRLTRAALISFQRANGLVPDGLAGRATLTKIRQSLPGVSSVLSGSFSWRLITEPRLAGFPAGVVEEALLSGDSPCTYPLPENYLRREGGLCPVAYLLRYDGETIDTKEKLKKTFTPVNSEKRAVSFVAVTEPDLSRKGEILSGSTASVGGNFFVKVIRDNTFGCGWHEKIEVIFQVSSLGDITLISSKTLPGTSPFSSIVCVD